MFKIESTGMVTLAVATAVASALLVPATSHAGGYIFARSNPAFQNLVTHPIGYTGQGGTLELNVCITPGSPNAVEMQQSVINNIAIWNKGQSTTSNLRPSLPTNTVDFESVNLHELGHCIGLSHPNLATESGVPDEDLNYTASIENAIGSGQFDLNPGADGIPGSHDDIRGDDRNMHFFYSGTNNPYSEQAVVDSTTYTLDLGSLPLGDTFPANADRDVSALPRFSSPNSETSMQQGVFGGIIQRTLGHDDVSTLRYGKSGIDELQGTDDDYDINLTYGGISNTNCDITVAMDPVQTGLAFCRTSPAIIQNSHVRITAAEIFYTPNVNWFFNDDPPCNESVVLEPDVWRLISLPCQVGISTSATVADVFGDDLGTGLFTDWGMFTYEYTENAAGQMAGAYRAMTLNEEIDSSKGYWIKTLDTAVTIDVQGEYHSEMDVALSIDSASNQTFGWNIVGMPFRFPVVWADTIAVDPLGNVLSLQESDPIVAGGVIPGGSGTACSDAALPTSACKVAQFGFKYDVATEAYVLLGPTSGTLNKWDAAWVFAGDEGYRVRFPMPTVERISP